MKSVLSIKHLVIFLLVSCFLVVCDQEPKNIETPPGFIYENFSDVHLNHWDALEAVEDGLVILYYYSPFCGYSGFFQPTITEYSYLHRDKVNLYFINAYQNRDQGEPDFEIIGIPVLIILNDREYVETIRGLDEIESYLTNLVSPDN